MPYNDEVLQKLMQEIYNKLIEYTIQRSWKRIEDIHYVVTNEDFEL